MLLDKLLKLHKVFLTQSLQIASVYILTILPEMGRAIFFDTSLQSL